MEIEKEVSFMNTVFETCVVEVGAVDKVLVSVLTFICNYIVFIEK